MKQIALVCVCVFFLIGRVSAELVRDTDVLLYEAEFSSLPNADLQLEFRPPSGFPELEEGIFLLSNELRVEGFAIGGETRLVLAEAGDVLTQSSLASFPSALVPPSETFPFGELGIPEGDSFVGFGLRPRADPPGPWNSIGWVQFRRSGGGLSMLGNATQHGPEVSGSIGASVGITVGVPEPRSSLGLALLMSLCLRHRVVAVAKASRRKDTSL